METIKELEADERLSYPTATLAENAPLALIQLELETKIKTLKGTLQSIDEVLLERRKQINRLKDEYMQAQLHTFINHFEDELKQKIIGESSK